MKHMTKRILAILLAALMLGTAVACTGSGDPADTDESVSEDTTRTTTDGTTAEPETEPETEPLPEDFVVTEENGTATVLTPAGLAYTVTGYTAADGGIFTFTDELTVSLADKSLEESFNRFTMHYSSDKPLRMFVTYGSKEDDYYLEAGSGDFSGLISGFMAKENGEKLTSLRIKSCVDGTASFSLTSLTTEQREVPEETFFIENDRFKLGVALHMGGGINYLEDKKDGDQRLSSLINQHDGGRLLQQSYYGVMENDEYKPGDYNGTPWCYNPVQGGDLKGGKSRIINFVVKENTVYVKAQPCDWGGSLPIAPAYMENTYTLFEDRVQVDNRFVDFSGWEHRYASQELPAFYTVSYLKCFSLYNGTKPWTGDTMSYRDDLDFWGSSAYHDDCSFGLRQSNTETWCAWTNKKGDFGIGLYVPNVDSYLAGRFLKDEIISKSAMDNPCCYVAPLKTIKLTAFEPLEYSYLVATGSLENIRKTFTDNKDFATNESLNKYGQSGRVADDAMIYNEYQYGQPIQVADPISANLDLTKEANCKHVSAAHSSEVRFSTEQNATVLKVTGGDPYVSISYADLLSADDYKKVKITYMIPTDNSSGNYLCDIFFCAGDIGNPTGEAVQRHNLITDGEYHVLEVDLSGEANWKGSIHSIRFDFFDGCSDGDVMFVKSVVLE